MKRIALAVVAGLTAVVSLFSVNQAAASADSTPFHVVGVNCGSVGGQDNYYSNASDTAESFRKGLIKEANSTYKTIAYTDSAYSDTNAVVGVTNSKGAPFCDNNISNFNVSYVSNVRHSNSGTIWEVDMMDCTGVGHKYSFSYFSNAMTQFANATIAMQAADEYEQVQIGLHDGGPGDDIGFAGNSQFTWRHNTTSGGC